MKNDTTEEIKIAVYQQNDQQLIEILTLLTAKNKLEQHEQVVKSCLRDVLAERHGPSEVEHIETLIEKKIAV